LIVGSSFHGYRHRHTYIWIISMLSLLQSIQFSFFHFTCTLFLLCNVTCFWTHNLFFPNTQWKLEESYKNVLNDTKMCNINIIPCYYICASFFVILQTFSRYILKYNFLSILSFLSLSKWILEIMPIFLQLILFKYMILHSVDTP
jgi:hypothetical protein